MTNEEQETELLDLVSACQSSYALKHGSNPILRTLGEEDLEENRNYIVQYVQQLIDAAITKDSQDAVRYRFLKPRLVGFDMSDHFGPGIKIVFSMPGGIRGGRACDANIDAGIAAVAAAEESSLVVQPVVKEFSTTDALVDRTDWSAA